MTVRYSDRPPYGVLHEHDAGQSQGAYWPGNPVLKISGNLPLELELKNFDSTNKAHPEGDTGVSAHTIPLNRLEERMRTLLYGDQGIPEGFRFPEDMLRCEVTYR